MESTPAWTFWANSHPQYQWISVDAVIGLLPGILMALTCFASGLNRQDLFLAKGDLNAPSTLFGRLRLNSWSRLGPLIYIFTGLLALQLLFTVRPNFQMASRLVLTAPVILAFAVINAFSEELRFRSVLLARLVPILRSRQALRSTSVLFGLAHWFGHLHLSQHLIKLPLFKECNVNYIILIL